MFSRGDQIDVFDDEAGQGMYLCSGRVIGESKWHGYRTVRFIIERATAHSCGVGDEVWEYASQCRLSLGPALLCEGDDDVQSG